MRYGRWAIAVVLFVLAVAVAAAARQPSSKYEMEIRRTSRGIELECRNGCNWMTLVGECDEEFPNCTYVVDERGLRVLADPEAADRDDGEN